jgi:drug/metabolite transporter (DMT)-like permease
LGLCLLARTIYFQHGKPSRAASVPFNTAFYAAAVAVIPVLFFAVALPGRFLVTAVIQAAKLRVPLLKEIGEPNKPITPKAHLLFGLGRILMYALVAVVFYAGDGEIISARALLHQKTTPNDSRTS